MTSWKYSAKGGEWGPMSVEQMRSAVFAGDVKLDTLVQKDDDGRWLLASATELRPDLEAANIRLGRPANRAAAPAPEVSKSSMSTKDWLSFASFMIVIAVLGYYVFGPKSFGASEIDDVKKSITAEFSKQDGVVVDEVTMVKESGQKLVGFAKLRISSIAVTKACTATLAEDGRQYLWQCR